MAVIKNQIIECTHLIDIIITITKFKSLDKNENLILSSKPFDFLIIILNNIGYFSFLYVNCWIMLLFSQFEYIKLGEKR